MLQSLRSFLTQPKEIVETQIENIIATYINSDDIDALQLLNKYIEKLIQTSIINVLQCNNKNKITTFIHDHKYTHLQQIIQCCKICNNGEVLLNLLTDPTINEDLLINILHQEENNDIWTIFKHLYILISYIDKIFIDNCNIGRIKMMEYLLKQGANVNILNSITFISSVIRNDIITTKFLLDNGANIHVNESSPTNNITPLCYSAAHGHLEMVQLLLAYGANVHAKNDRAIIASSCEGHITIVKLLSDYDMFITPPDALIGAATYGHYDVLKLLLDKGADVHANDDMALLRSALNYHPKCVRLLLDYGANIHANNDIVLRECAKKKSKIMVKLLISNGANIHVNNDEILQYIEKCNDVSYLKFLVDHGIDIDAIDKNVNCHLNDDVLEYLIEQRKQKIKVKCFGELIKENKKLDKENKELYEENKRLCEKIIEIKMKLV